jgi:exopolysaccharide biosynthesis protein
VVGENRTPAVTITRGVTEYAETFDTMRGREQAHVLDLDLAERNIRLGVVEAGNAVTDPADETVSSMGTRTHAVAGVNGGYFQRSTSGAPIGGVITNGRLLASPHPGSGPELGVRADGTIVMGRETFTGRVTEGAASHVLASVNTVDDVGRGGISEVTPSLGATSLPAAATLVLGHAKPGSGTLEVTRVQQGARSISALPEGEEGLVGGGSGGRWLAAAARVGGSLALSERISPDNDLVQMINAAAILVRHGKIGHDPAGPTGINPETAVGLSRDGSHAILATIDGRLGTQTSVGVTAAQMAGYMLAHGAYTAILLDGGGSTEMVAREPGATGLSVLNTPADGQERPVANGIFVYASR